MAIGNMLKEIYLFKDLDGKELELIGSIATEQKVSQGDEIFVIGQEAKSFFVIRLGSVKIFTTTKTGTDSNIAMLGSGSHFGEIPYLDGGKRTATALVAETCHLVEIPYEKLRDVMSQNEKMAVKVYKAWGKFLAARLRATLDDLGQARETKLKHF